MFQISKGGEITPFILMQISNRIEEIFQISDINTFTSSKKLNLGEKNNVEFNNLSTYFTEKTD